VVTLVQSGFFTGADWENEWFDSTNYGWEFMLLGLRTFLEFHRGQTRRVAWLHQPGKFPRAVIYEKLLAPGGLFREDAIEILHPGKPFMLYQHGSGAIVGGHRIGAARVRNLFAHFRMARRIVLRHGGRLPAGI
jgi:hypothetical protein